MQVTLEMESSGSDHDEDEKRQREMRATSNGKIYGAVVIICHDSR